jgi:WD40 repeat protein
VEAVINRVIEKSNGTGRLLLVVDQFEELFTNTPETGQVPFAKALLHARGRAPVTILITLSADFYSQIIALDRELSDVLASGQVNIGALTPDELRESITAPARLVGLEFESGLVDRILSDVGSEPGRLPLVEFALTEIWQRREERRLTNQAYDEIGGVTGALARRAEAEFGRLNPEEQKGAHCLFSRLVRVARPEESGEDTRQRAELVESDTLARRVAKRLADERLLVTSGETGTGTISVEVAHEVLIRNWKRLRNWLNEDREFLLWRQRLSGLLGEWERALESNEALLRGPLLIEAQKWIDQRSQDLSDQERKFISASLEERERLTQEEKERQDRELEAARKLAEALRERAEEAEKREQEQKESAQKLQVESAAAEEQAKIANEQRIAARTARVAAEEQARVAESRRLAAESSSVLTKYPQRSLLLAVEAVKVEQPLHGVRVGADEQSLREALGFIGGRLVGKADGPITTLAISPNNRWLVTGSFDKTGRLWDLSAKDPAANPVLLRGHEDGVNAVAISADSRWVVTGSGDGTARLWDLRAKDPAADSVVLRGHENGVNAMAISPDNRLVVTGSRDTTARLWDLSAKDPAANPVVLRGHAGFVNAVAISPDNRWLVTGSYDNTARFWDLYAKDPATKPVVLGGHKSYVHAVAISPDTHWVVTGSSDDTARLWDLRAKKPAASPVVLRGHDGEVYAVAVSPDNRWLVTGSGDKTARLWDLSAKDPAANPVVLRGHDKYVNAVAISADSRLLVTGSDDKTARLWLLQMNDLVDLARTTAGRNFYADEWNLYFPGEKYCKTFPDLPGPDAKIISKIT